jgi:hypothetical protein
MDSPRGLSGTRILPLLELARVLVCLDRVARRVVNTCENYAVRPSEIVRKISPGARLARLYKLSWYRVQFRVPLTALALLLSSRQYDVRYLQHWGRFVPSAQASYRQRSRFRSLRPASWLCQSFPPYGRLPFNKRMSHSYFHLDLTNLTMLRWRFDEAGTVIGRCSFGCQLRVGKQENSIHVHTGIEIATRAAC